MTFSDQKKTRLSVNVNKFALVRNSRGGDRPHLVSVARRLLEGGAAGITVHPREDQRHVRYRDVYELAALLKEFPRAELNVEGTPNEELLKVVCEARPHQCTLVPDLPGQLTSDHGWPVRERLAELRQVTSRLHDVGVRVSLFLDPDPAHLTAVKEVGADRVELYTGPYAEAFSQGHADREVSKYASTADQALDLGIQVNAGHDLDQKNLGYFVEHVRGVEEVSIGHAFVCECFDEGLERTLSSYLSILKPLS
jgi:pyridoxine 5-phosphate synthase